MKANQFRWARQGAVVLALGLVAACTQGNAGTMSGNDMSSMHHDMPMAATSKAADLRAALDELLSEHLILAVDATGAALGGRDADFKAAAASLDQNSVNISKAVGSVYGPEAEAKFLPLWREHIGLVVDYTVGTASNDPAKAKQAVDKLWAYSGDLANFFAGANPELNREAVAEMIKTHIVTLKAVIDAQSRKDYAAEYAAQHKAYNHMGMIAVALADGIAKQFPQKFS
jgi:hypothetical protein